MTLIILQIIIVFFMTETISEMSIILLNYWKVKHWGKYIIRTKSKVLRKSPVRSCYSCWNCVKGTQISAFSRVLPSHTWNLVIYILLLLTQICNYNSIFTIMRKWKLRLITQCQNNKKKWLDPIYYSRNKSQH